METCPKQSKGGLVHGNVEGPSSHPYHWHDAPHDAPRTGLWRLANVQAADAAANALAYPCRSNVGVSRCHRFVAVAVEGGTGSCVGSDAADQPAGTSLIAAGICSLSTGAFVSPDQDIDADQLSVERMYSRIIVVRG